MTRENDAQQESRSGTSVSVPAKKGIVLVHGMGAPKKGDTLYRFVNPVVRHMTERRGFAPRMQQGFSSEDADKLSILTLDYPEQKWLFVDAWWAQSFPPAKFDPAVGWATTRAAQHLGSLFVAMARYFFLGLLALALYGQLRTKRLVATTQKWNPRKRDQLRDPQLKDAYQQKYRAFSDTFDSRLKKSYTIQRKWAQDTDEVAILEELQEPFYYRDREGYLRLLFWVVSVFHLLNALIMLVVFSLASLLIPLAVVLVTALNLVSGVPGVPAVIRTIKRGLDTFLVGSLGDIQVFLENPLEAQQIRGQVEKALAFLDQEGCSQIYLVAHSTGSPICYEVLVNPSDAELTRKVRGLFTCGSIMRLAWHNSARRRPSFRQPLPLSSDCLEWHNFWARYDVAHPGPIKREAERRTGDASRVIDIPVTNENSLLNDHVTYESNRAQFINHLVASIWGDRSERSHFPLTAEQERANTILRLERVLQLALPRLLLVYSIPALFVLFSQNLDWVGGWSHWLFSQLGQEGWADEHLRYPLVNGIGADAGWEKVLAVAVVTILVVIVGYILYLLYKNIFWERREPKLYPRSDADAR